MNKNDKKEILEFYTKDLTVKVYDKKRFSGKGGQFVNSIERGSIVKFIEKSKSILELGPGTGRLTVLLSRNSPLLFALDSSKEMLKILKNKLKKISIINQSVFDKIKLTQKVDVVTGLRFFDHFSLNDQHKILKNILPNLKKNGYIIYSSLNSSSLESVLSVFFYFSKTNYFYSFDEYEKLFKKLNLYIVTSKTYFILPRGIFLRAKKNDVFYKFIVSIESLLNKIFKHNGALFTFVLKNKK